MDRGKASLVPLKTPAMRYGFPRYSFAELDNERDHGFGRGPIPRQSVRSKQQIGRRRLAPGRPQHARLAMSLRRAAISSQ